MRALTDGVMPDLLFYVGVNVGICRRGKLTFPNVELAFTSSVKLGFTGVVTMSFHGAAMSKMLLNVTCKTWVF